MKQERIFVEAATVIGHEFVRPALLVQALTHRSFSCGRGIGYERLEFLGDRVLALVTADMLMAAFPAEDEGKLSKRFVALVCGQTLATIARELDLGRFLRLARNEEEGGGRSNPAILADALEAVIGCLYLDAGLPAAREFIETHWRARMAAATTPPEDVKTWLQEWVQAAGKPLPRYETVGVYGPGHSPIFSVVLTIEGLAPVKASGPSKRAAEKAAATAMIDAVGRDTRTPR